MRYCGRLLIFVLLLFVLQSSIVRAASPQTLVMNFAQINELNWAAPEEEWQEQIKPRIIKELVQMRTALTPSRYDPHTTNRQLAWSTLMEYMNIPLDIPSDNSVYVIKMKRILQIAEELDFPVFVPLNGYQWWDQLPELYNWWDSDGTQTDPAFFNRQKNPAEFKQRFIRGYNPENKWNVEWQDWKTPMKLNYRNWGGGGFRLAPPPNLLFNDHAPVSYRTVQNERLNAILSVISNQFALWQKLKKDNLLVGVSIGTEVSLNASVTKQDEFAPYGYRGIQDLLCPPTQPTCKENESLPFEAVLKARQDVVNQYLTETTRLASKQGIPKERLYTHVFSETTSDNPKFTNYAHSAYTLYANPGLSFYGYAHDPLSLPVFNQMLQTTGYPSWGAVEYSTPMTTNAWKTGLSHTFDSTQSPATLLVHYNWPDPKGTGAVTAMRAWLQSSSPKQTCTLPSITATTDDFARSPQTLSWEMDQPHTTITTLLLHIQPGITAYPNKPDLKIILPSLTTSTQTPTVSAGNYTWYVEITGCSGMRRTSTPRNFTVLPIVVDSTPSWVRYIETIRNSLRL